MGVAREVATEGGGGAVSLGKVLSRSSSGSAIVWGRDVGDFGANGAEVRGSVRGFPTSRNKVKGKASEGRVMATGGGKNTPSESEYTAAPDLRGQETGDSSGVGGPTAYFRRLYERDRILGRGKDPGAMVETGDIREAAEGHCRIYFGSGKGAAATGIRQSWQE